MEQSVRTRCGSGRIHGSACARRTRQSHVVVRELYQQTLPNSSLCLNATSRVQCGADRLQARESASNSPPLGLLTERTAAAQKADRSGTGSVSVSARIVKPIFRAKQNRLPSRETRISSASGRETRISSASGRETRISSASGRETRISSASGRETRISSASGRETRKSKTTRITSNAPPTSGQRRPPPQAFSLDVWGYLRPAMTVPVQNTTNVCKEEVPPPNCSVAYARLPVGGSSATNGVCAERGPISTVRSTGTTRLQPAACGTSAGHAGTSEPVPPPPPPPPPAPRPSAADHPSRSPGDAPAGRTTEDRLGALEDKAGRILDTLQRLLPARPTGKGPTADTSLQERVQAVERKTDSILDLLKRSDVLNRKQAGCNCQESVMCQCRRLRDARSVKDLQEAADGHLAVDREHGVFFCDVCVNPQNVEQAGDSPTEGVFKYDFNAGVSSVPKATPPPQLGTIKVAVADHFLSQGHVQCLKTLVADRKRKCVVREELTRLAFRGLGQAIRLLKANTPPTPEMLAALTLLRDTGGSSLHSRPPAPRSTESSGARVASARPPTAGNAAPVPPPPEGPPEASAPPGTNHSSTPPNPVEPARPEENSHLENSRLPNGPASSPRQGNEYPESYVVNSSPGPQWEGTETSEDDQVDPQKPSMLYVSSFPVENHEGDPSWSSRQESVAGVCPDTSSSESRRYLSEASVWSPKSETLTCSESDYIKSEPFDDADITQPNHAADASQMRHWNLNSSPVPCSAFDAVKRELDISDVVMADIPPLKIETPVP